MVRNGDDQKYLDISLSAIKDDLTDLIPKKIIMSVPIQGHSLYIPTSIDLRFSPDRSKLLVYVRGLVHKQEKNVGKGDEKQLLVCAVVEASGSALWNMTHGLENEGNGVKDFQVTDDGDVYLLTQKELHRMTEQGHEMFEYTFSDENGLFRAAMDIRDDKLQIIGFIWSLDKSFKSGKLISFIFDPVNNVFSPANINEFHGLDDFDPWELVIKRFTDGYWVAASDKRGGTTNDMFICRVDNSGIMEWALHVPKRTITAINNEPEVILIPKENDLIVLFEESEENSEAREKGKETGFKGTQPIPDYNTAQMTVSADKKYDIKWLEIDGARIRWGNIQQIDEDTYFSGNARKGEERGFVYWNP
ncbi:MAG: hypothetical protein M3R08_00170 [Bacteroidota bacterium]|nr:hypothetical protein [Bacteroidota bacterium]